MAPRVFSQKVESTHTLYTNSLPPARRLAKRVCVRPFFTKRREKVRPEPCLLLSLKMPSEFLRAYIEALEMIVKFRSVLLTQINREQVKQRAIRCRYTGEKIGKNYESR